jgi:hypothetical protein
VFLLEMDTILAITAKYERIMASELAFAVAFLGYPQSQGRGPREKVEATNVVYVKLRTGSCI